MKTTILSALLISMVLCLCACGQQAAPEPTPAPASAPPAPVVTSTLPGADITAAPAPVEEAPAAPEYDEEKFNAALDYKGKDVSDLYEAIGEPADSSYASSCLGQGDDGELYYDGFTVATYREGEKETVREVYVNEG